jgi:hypothetical protein
MGDEDPLDPVGALRQPVDVRQDQVDTRLAVHVGKGHARIHDDQALRPLLAIAVDVAIHPDLPRAAEGEVDQPVSVTHEGPWSLL